MTVDAQRSRMPEADWDDVLDVIELLIDDGYEVADFTASTPEPAPEKRFTLEVHRPVLDGVDDDTADNEKSVDEQ